MAAILKHWREAATLMLVTSRDSGKQIKFKPLMSSNKNENQNSLRGHNFEIMLLKRSSKSKFMPNLYVFPGGVASNADFSDKWRDIFHEVNSDLMKNTFEYVKRGGAGPPMFSRIRDDQFSSIPSEIAFRICAIRETFEESGVLLARSIKDLKTIDSRFMYKNEVNASSYESSMEILESWRKHVYADASQFINLCQELKIVPDVWSLYEWSNWLTPTGEDKFGRSGRRFDTAFFVACISDKPDAVQDHGETVHLQWGSPTDVIEEYKNNNASIAPPQLYELSRLLNFSDIKTLHRFLWQREPEGIQRYFPIQIRCEDAYLSLLPGDDLYPDQPDLVETKLVGECTETLEELNSKYPAHHRTFISRERNHLQVACNIPMIGGHVRPLSDIPTVDTEIFDSKL